MSEPERRNKKTPRVEATGEFDREPKVHFVPFPATRDAETPLPICFTRDAYADLLSHAKDHLDVEVCGVLVGRFCEDDDGEYVSVEAIIQGRAARQGGTHVTFTQETWNHIHERMEANHRKRDIVGWYHTHPGFGVEFSEMDLFIQNNFFSGHNQIAFLTDPLSNDEAICLTRNGAAVPLPYFWVDGRRRACHVPTDVAASTTGGADPVHSPHQLERSLKTIEERMHQTLRAIDKQRNALYQMLLTLGLMAGFGIIIVFAYSLYRQYTTDFRPPESIHFADVPVRVGDDVYLIGVDAVQWKMPKKMSEAFLDSVKQDILEEQQRARKKAEDAARLAAEKSGATSSKSKD